ncbi:MAG: flavodoxin family protein [Zhaonellaceae bacterium]|jgi:multimeric flavodoxin WrbA|nr:flavodoxin family protein [Clostridia bacterium]
MKVLFLNGSPRRGATEKILLKLKEKYSAPGVEIEIISLAGKKVAPCNGCNYCKKNQTNCRIKDDMVELYQKFIEADAYIIASPVYVMGPTPQLSAFFSRLRPVHHVNKGVLLNKIGGSVAVGGTRNGGQELTVDIINNYLLTRGLAVVGGEIGQYHGGKIWSKDSKEEALNDNIGMDTAYGVVGRVIEMARLIEKGKNASVL